LYYGGSADFRGRRRAQGEVFTEVTREWAERGYQTVVIGAHPDVEAGMSMYGLTTEHVTLVKPADLFKVGM
jgi:hypothetical protein